MAFELWRPQLGLTRRTLGKYVVAARGTTDPNVGKGVCNDADAAFGERYTLPAAAQIKDGGMRVHCFEPSQANYDLLQSAHTHFFADKPQDQDRLQVRRLAFSNYTATTFFSKGCNTELCQIQATGENADVVAVTTVDAMADKLKLDQLFWLKTDTEGFDPLVLQGAYNTLSTHKVTLLTFEYHGIGMWGKDGHTLQNVVHWLDSLGYVCFLDGELLTLLTGCWHPSFEFRDWSNVVCTLKGHPVHGILMAYSVAPRAYRFAQIASSI